MGSVAVNFQFLMIDKLHGDYFCLLDFHFNNNSGDDELKYSELNFGQFIFIFINDN